MAKQKKGTAGKNTGGATRAAIRKATARGATLAKIGAGSNRDASTIGDILGGKIKNPPKGLAGRINKVKGIAGKKGVTKPKGTKETAAHRRHK